MNASERGFTLIEIMVAVVVLSIGVIALAGSSATVTRMVGRGQTTTVAAQVASRRLEILRNVAASTATPCTSAKLVSGSQTTSGVVESWTVTSAFQAKNVTVFVTYPLPGGRARTDTVSTVISCFL